MSNHYPRWWHEKRADRARPPTPRCRICDNPLLPNEPTWWVSTGEFIGTTHATCWDHWRQMY